MVTITIHGRELVIKLEVTHFVVPSVAFVFRFFDCIEVYQD
jgi:hypothetical protein